MAQATSAKKQTQSGGSKSISQKKASASEPSFNMDELRELAALVNENGFTDFEFENANIRVRLSKNPAPQFLQAMPQQQYANAPAASLTSTQNVSSNTEAQSNSTLTENTATEDDNLIKITSPIVGTFYAAPAPDKEPYVKEGSVVAIGATVCIVEAMKLMNEIESEFAGEIVKIYVENGQPVEFGQALFGIKK